MSGKDKTPQIQEEIIEKMIELNEQLQEAAKAYYNEDREVISNFEYDKFYDALAALEEVHGVLLDDSITQRVGADVSSIDGSQGLPKVRHETPMLSLAKTKSREELVQWLGDNRGCLSWKLDGSTVVLTYENGKLVTAITRGNGEVGEDITPQAKKFAGVPKSIAYKGKLVIRGEAVMTYSEFERINAEIEDVESKYKNPRNLASGTMRALDESVLDDREISFHPFTVVSISNTSDMEDDGFDANSYSARLDWLDSMGFESVEHIVVTANDLVSAIDAMEDRVEGEDVPSDGLVLFFDDVAYGEGLGSTSHAPKNGIAFKWADETSQTRLLDIIWRPSRTGRINPVAVFEPVELEGTTVERATLNNVTFMRDLLGDNPHKGQELEVYKANKIIPTIVWANQDAGKVSDALEIPHKCPSCDGPAEVIDEHGSEFLMCENPECPAKRREALVHFASRNALDIYGLSKETLEKFMDAGVVISFSDLLDLPQKRDEVVGRIEGIGEKSFNNLCAAIEKARHVTAARFLYSLGIREIGRSASADIAKCYNNDVQAIIDDAAAGRTDDFLAIDGIGKIMCDELCEYMEYNKDMVEHLLSKVEISDTGETGKTEDNAFIEGKTFVVTGGVEIFSKRDELKDYIRERGGNLAGSVSKKTDYLITNTPDSGTSKNAKAQELGVPIITESQFCEMAGYEGE